VELLGGRIAQAGQAAEAVEAVERVYRDDYGRVLATLIRVFGDFDLAEDALQDALIAAADHWPAEGIPSNPPGWVVITARRKALDRLRRDQAQTRLRERLEREQEAGGTMDASEPDLLRLIFTCCHPALGQEAQVALTLRTVCGLTTGEVARAFPMAEPAAAQRLVRAKRKIREARTRGGELVLLEDQDRARWDRAEIDEGLSTLDRSIRLKAQRPASACQLQAAIAALHAQAASAEATDWHEIAALYGELERIHGTPVVRLNRSVALAMAEGPARGLGVLDELDPTELDGFHPFHAARADLLRRAGRRAEAAAAYERAIALCGNAVERRYLEGRLAEVRA